MGSVQFQIVPCSSLYFFSRSIGLFQCLVNANCRFLICCNCHYQSGSLFFFLGGGGGFLCLKVFSVSNFCPDTRGQRRSLIWTHLFSRAVGREKHRKQISLACVGSARSVWATLGLALLRACVFFPCTLLRLQMALQGHCPKRALGFVHFPGPSCSGSGSQVSTVAQTQLGVHFVPSSEQLRRPGAWRVRCPRWAVRLNHLLCPSLSVSRVRSGNTVSGVLYVSSGELTSGCDPPVGCRPSRIPGSLG